MEIGEQLEPFAPDEPVQLRLFPPTKAQLYDYLRTLMQLFDSVTVLRVGDALTDGVLVDVWVDNEHDLIVGFEQLKRSFLNIEYPPYLS